MHVQRFVVPVTVDASGDATAYSPVVTGRVLQIHYVKTDYANGVDFTITSEATGQQLWVQVNQDSAAIKAPRQPTYDGVGVASLYAAGGEPVEDHIYLANDRVKIVVAAGGVSKTGTFHVVIG
jgi:hypothetical protein